MYRIINLHVLVSPPLILVLSNFCKWLLQEIKNFQLNYFYNKKIKQASNIFRIFPQVFSL